MESGDSQSEEIFSSESQDECPTKVLTYAKYTKLLDRNISMKRKVILRTSDSSNSNKENDVEQDCLPSTKRRRHTEGLDAAMCRNTQTPLTQHTVEAFGVVRQKGWSNGSVQRGEQLHGTSCNTNPRKRTSQSTVGKGKQQPLALFYVFIFIKKLVNHSCKKKATTCYLSHLHSANEYYSFAHHTHQLWPSCD